VPSSVLVLPDLLQFQCKCIDKINTNKIGQ
jgi:hypothetical protein